MADMGISEMAQAVLMGYDTHLSSKWREEERGWKAEERRWRKEDLLFRQKEFEAMEANASFMDEQRRWHDLELGQRALDNGRVLWQRFVEKNRRSVEEHAEQLKSIANLAALVAGFSVIGFLEFQFVPEEHPGLLVTMFGIFTALTVVLMVNSFVACSLVHGSILKTGKRYVAEPEEADFMAQMHHFVATYREGARPPMPGRTFEQHWQQRCETEWRRSFGLFTLGVPCFLVQLALAAWIKFQNSVPTAIAMSVIIFGSSAYWVVVQKTWAEHLFSPEDQYKTATPDTPVLGLPFDFHRAPEDWVMGQTAMLSTSPSDQGSVTGQHAPGLSATRETNGWAAEAPHHRGGEAETQQLHSSLSPSPGDDPPRAGPTGGMEQSPKLSLPSLPADAPADAINSLEVPSSGTVREGIVPPALQPQPPTAGLSASQAVELAHLLQLHSPVARLSAKQRDEEQSRAPGRPIPQAVLPTAADPRCFLDGQASRGQDMLYRWHRSGRAVHDICLLPVVSSVHDHHQHRHGAPPSATQQAVSSDVTDSQVSSVKCWEKPVRESIGLASNEQPLSSDSLVVHVGEDL